MYTTMINRELLLKIIGWIAFMCTIIANLGLLLSCYTIFDAITSKNTEFTHLSVIMFSFFACSLLFWKYIKKYLH